MTELVLPHTLSGPRDGLCVMMINPLGGEKSFWKEASAGFGPGVRAVACDLRGTGEAPLPDGPLTVEQNVADMETLRRSLGAERLLVIGCAVGSMAAALYAARHPDRTVGLVMSNPGVRIASAASDNLRARAALVREKGMAALVPAVTEPAFAGRPNDGARQMFEARLLGQDPEGYALLVLGACGADIGPFLPSIACPTLLVCGDNDNLLPADVHAREIEAAVPQARRVTFPDGAHFIPFQQPQAFAEQVSAFLDSEDLRKI